MPSIKIDRFGGMNPKLKRGQGDVSLASFAQNTNLESGSIKPWRYPSLELETTHDKLCTIYKEECCWFMSENPCASFTRGDTDCPRIFSTGVMPWPAYATIPDGDSCCETQCEVEWCRLGVPKPENAPDFIGSSPIRPPVDRPVITTGDYDCTIQGNYKVVDYLGDVEEGEPDPMDEYCDQQGYPEADGTFTSDYGKQVYREPRAYYYTFVNEYGEEGPPSDPTEVWDVDVDGNAILGLNIPPMDGGFCDPVAIRIYRAVPSSAPPEPEGFNSSIHDKIDILNYNASVSAAFFFVDEIDYREGIFQYNDVIPAIELGEANLTDSNLPPIANLENIQVLENGSLIASHNKQLWFSEPYNFHAWNCAMDLEDCIVNFKVARRDIYVATNGYPYIVAAQPLENEECLCCRQVNRILEPAPIVSGCSMVLTNTGAMWASNAGLVRMTGNQLKVVTHNIMGENDWQEYLPHQLKGAFYKGKYFGFNSERGFVYDLVDGIYAENYPGEHGKFSELNLTPDALYRTDGNILYMSFDGDLFRWDAADTYMPYTWRSKLHIEGGTRNYSIMKIVFEDWLRTRKSPHESAVRLYADDKLIFQRTVSCSRPFRLPKGFDAINFNIEVTGIEPIGEIHMATSKVELTALNNS